MTEPDMIDELADVNTEMLKTQTIIVQLQNQARALWAQNEIRAERIRQIKHLVRRESSATGRVWFNGRRFGARVVRQPGGQVWVFASQPLFTRVHHHDDEDAITQSQ